MKTKTRNMDMINGPLFMKIVKFSIPFMLTAMLQQFYNAADVIVVGRYAGQEALAGVGTTGSLTNLILNLFLGLSAGVSVVIGNALGSEDETAVSKIVHTAISISIIGGTIVAFIGIVFAELLLKMIDVPENIMPHAKIYMQIVFIGKLPALIYNFGSAILRAKGDTQRPFYIILISGFINVGLNLYFVIALKMGSAGVALATAISQLFTAIVVLYILCKENDSTRLFFRKLRIYKKYFLNITRIGIPSGLQGMIFSISNVLMQSSINSFGSAAIAGSAAATNIGEFYGSALNAFYQASLVFVSQNFGAKKYDRINRIVKCCIIDVAIVWVIQIFITVFAGEFLIGCYVPGDTEAIKLGLIKFMNNGCTYGMLGLMNVMTGTLRGMGWSISGMISSIVGVCGIRIMWILFVFPHFRSLEMLYISYPLSWGGTFIFHMLLYIYAKRKLSNT